MLLINREGEEQKRCRKIASNLALTRRDFWSEFFIQSVMSLNHSQLKFDEIIILNGRPQNSPRIAIKRTKNALN
jgi:hypothetical protein